VRSNAGPDGILGVAAQEADRSPYANANLQSRDVPYTGIEMPRFVISNDIGIVNIVIIRTRWRKPRQEARFCSLWRLRQFW